MGGGHIAFSHFFISLVFDSLYFNSGEQVADAICDGGGQQTHSWFSMFMLRRVLFPCRLFAFPAGRSWERMYPNIDTPNVPQYAVRQQRILNHGPELNVYIACLRQ